MASDPPRRRYTPDELKALRPLAPSLSARALEALGSARVGFTPSRAQPPFRSSSPPTGSPPRRGASIPFSRMSPPRARSPEPRLVPVDASWLRPHPLLDGELEPSGAVAIPGANGDRAFPRMSPDHTPSSSPPPGFGPLAKGAVKQSAAARDAFYRSRVCKGPDMSANFASRIRFRDRLIAVQGRGGDKSNDKSGDKAGDKSDAHIPAASSALPPVPQTKPPRSVFEPIEECRTSDEIDRLFALPQQPVPIISAPGGNHVPGFRPLLQPAKVPAAAEPTEKAADQLSRWFHSITRDAGAGTAFSSEADKRAQQQRQRVPAASTAPASVAPVAKPPPAQPAVPMLAPNVLSFFDSIRAEAAAVGRGGAPASRTTPVVPAPGPRKPMPQLAQPAQPAQTESVRNFFDMFSENGTGKMRAEPAMARPLEPFLGAQLARPEREVLRATNSDIFAHVAPHPVHRPALPKPVAAPGPAPSATGDAGDLQRWFAALSARNAR